MKNMGYMFFMLTIVSSLAFGQIEKGTKLMDGSLSIASVTPVGYDGEKLDTITATSLSLTYGQFVMDQLLISGSLAYLNVGCDGCDGKTDISLGLDYFFNDSWYVGFGVMAPDEGDSEMGLGVGMLSPFRESSNVHLHPYFQYWLDSELITAGVGLTLLF